MLKAIDLRIHNNFVIDAGFHGIKIPLRYNAEQLKEETETEDEEFDPACVEKAMLESQARVKARYGR